MKIPEKHLNFLENLEFLKNTKFFNFDILYLWNYRFEHINFIWSFLEFVRNYRFLINHVKTNECRNRKRSHTAKDCPIKHDLRYIGCSVIHPTTKNRWILIFSNFFYSNTMNFTEKQQETKIVYFLLIKFWEFFNTVFSHISKNKKMQY